MKAVRESLDASVVASLSRHLAFSPVAFAVTEGPAHVLRYANDAFRRLEADGEISIGQVRSGGGHKSTDLAPLLDRAFRGGETLRDELLAPAENKAARWSCTVWPISPATAAPEGVVIEVRDTSYIEGARSRQRAIAERLLIGALRDQDTAREAIEESRRTAFLAAASRELAMSLDPDATREVVRRRTLPREGTWCIVDLIEPNGVIHRLAVVHPDPKKQALARTLADNWYPRPGDPTRAPRPTAEAVVLTSDSGPALLAAAHGAQNLSTLRALGFGTLLVVPLVVHARVLGSITFVTNEGDPPFTSQEISLASDLADRCAMALDNARLYRETDVLRAAADVASRAKSEFLGNMSHELRTPLNVIGGYAELMEMGLRGPITEEQRADLIRIKDSQLHLLTLISEILNFVRNETGRLEYHFHSVLVNVAIREVAQMLDGAAKERRLTLVPPPDGPDDAAALAWADANRVRQILTNLVMNAVKYTPAGGGAITLTSSVERNTVTVHVTDSGNGIPSDKLEAIFEPFVQLASGLTERQGGVGLGLAISRDLARAMMGDLTVESTVGVGSRFTLTLPRAPSDAAASLGSP